MPTLCPPGSPPEENSLPAAPESNLAADEVRARVWGLLGTLYPRTVTIERRRETRYPFPFLIQLTPVAAAGEAPCGESLVVVGKDISERGLGFYHPQPLAHRLVIASMEGPRGDWYAFLTDLTWCRFKRQGWYESGGRFLEVVRSPLAG